PADSRLADVVRRLSLSLSEPALPLAELPLPAGVGRVRDLDVSLGQHRLLHRGPRPGHRSTPRRLHRLAQAHLLDARTWVGGLGHAVASLPARLRPLGRAGHAARALGPQRRVLGLRDGARPGLALDALRALLRRRRDLLRVRDGADPDPAHATLLPPARLYPGQAPGRDGQAHSRHGPRAHVLLHLRDLHLDLQRGAHREGLALLEGDRNLRVGLVDDVLLQLRGPADPLLEARAHEPGDPLRRVHPGADRDVVRALQYHRALARPRLLPVHLGHLLSKPDRYHDRDRQLLVLLPALPRLHQAAAVAVDRGGEGDDCAAGPGPSPWPLRRSSASSPTWTRRCGRSSSSARGATTTSRSTPRCPSTR